jgi:hypothetical protein
MQSGCKRARTESHLHPEENNVVDDRCCRLVEESKTSVVTMVLNCDGLERCVDAACASTPAKDGRKSQQARDIRDSPFFANGHEGDVNCAHGQVHLENPDFGKVAYFRSARYNELASKIERNGNRAILVESLIDALDILQNFDVVEVDPATRQMLQHFHSTDYVSALENHHVLSDRQLAKFGLIHDCPVFDGLFDLVCLGKQVQPDSAAKLPR